MGALRAVDFITSLPQYNGKALGVTGSSQGGALSMVTAALDKRVTFYAAIHPAMCDHRAHLQKVAGGWPHYFYYFPTPTPQRIQTADYYDMVNFARRITVPGWFSWGYNDDVCPPTSTYAAYNSITAPRNFTPIWKPDTTGTRSNTNNGANGCGRKWDYKQETFNFIERHNMKRNLQKAY